MFTNDVILVDENKNVLGNNLKCLKEIVEKNGLKISRPKTKCLQFKFKYEET